MSGLRFDLCAIPPQPWKNGAGLTREIAFAGASAVDFDWRISVAEVAHDAPFSAFAGVDRCITLLSGAGLRLRAHDGSLDHALTRPLTPFRFAGETALTATLIGGACSDFNVMTRRGRYRSEVSVLRAITRLPDASITLLLCCVGEWVVGDETLAPQQGLLWRTASAAMEVRPVSANAVLLHVRLCHDHIP